uniref:Polyprotein n=1 Tax=Cajanus cajan TaxID=3821 RepID=A0A151SF95_CAJCA|nr:hypothetical protein KK1_024614 [Cajanus cajan]
MPEIHLRIVLQVSRNKQSSTKLCKCEFWLEEVKFLGHDISKEIISVNPSKVEVGMQVEEPKIVIEIRSFLGLIGYFYGSKFDSDCNSFDQEDLNIRQRRLMKFIKDYDFQLLFHRGMAKVLVNHLDRKVIHVSAMMKKETELIFGYLNQYTIKEKDKIKATKVVAWEENLPLVEITYNNPDEAFHGCKCRTSLVWCKSYVDKRIKPLEFQKRDHVFLKVTLVTRADRSIKSNKFTPKCSRPYQILRRVEIDKENPTIEPNPIKIEGRRIRRLRTERNIYH